MQTQGENPSIAQGQALKNAEIAAVAKRYGVTNRFLSNGFL